MTKKGKLQLEQNIDLGSGVILNVKTYRKDHVTTIYGTVIYEDGSKRKLEPISGNFGYYVWKDNRIYSWNLTELSTTVFNIAAGRKIKITREEADALENVIDEQHQKGINTSISVGSVDDLGNGKKLVSDSSLELYVFEKN